MQVSFEVSRAMPGKSGDVYPAACASRTVLDHVTSKWGVLVLLALNEGTLRWGELRRVIQGISEKMLASTLRTLEADGFIARESFPEVPPRVEYRLTERGSQLSDRMVPLMDWIADNADEIVAPAR